MSNETRKSPVAKLAKSFGTLEYRKSWRLSLLFFLTLIAMVVETHAAEPSETTLNSRLLGQFLQKHCVRCHGPEEQNGSARFDRLDYAISDAFEALHYQDVLDVLNGGDMPPEDEPQPTNAELEGVIGELTEGLFEARKRLASNGGRVAMRRLNRREYAETIDHLFGFVPAATKIPPDDDVVNFDTVGSRQHFTTEHVDQYYDLGREILTVAFKWAGKREALKTDRQDPEKFWNWRFRKDIEDWKGKEGKVVRLSKVRQTYLDRPMVETGVYLDDAMGQLQFGFGVDPRASYRLHVVAGFEGKVSPVRRFLRVRNTDRVLAVFHIDGTTENPKKSVVEIRPVALRDGKISGRVGEDKRDKYSHYVWLLDKIEGIRPEENDGIIWIDSFQIEGPFYPEQPSFFEALLCPGELSPDRSAERVWNDANADELIARFTNEALRHRDVDPNFLEGLGSYFRTKREKGSDFEQAMIDTLAVVLASPSFVFLNEQAVAKVAKTFGSATDRNSPRVSLQESRGVSSREQAIRLAYFLTSGPPDDSLYQAVEAGAMSDPGSYRQEVSRILDENSRQLAEGFISQWADFVRFDSISVGKQFPTFNDGLRYSMKQEAIAYFQTLIDENLPVSNLIQSDFATVNAQLATHYGIPDVTTNAFTKVSLPNDSPRGGFMTQGAFLVAGSNGERTSPAVRGMILMTRFLNSPPPPPPPNVPELGSDIEGPMTNRKLVELHQTRAQCASCHRKMDTIGLALENFDTIGRWRENEKTSFRTQEPVVIDGALPGGERFTDFKQFQSTLLEHEEHLARNMIESLLVYALGRDIEFTDDPHIENIMTQLRLGRFRVRDMIQAVASSPLFLEN